MDFTPDGTGLVVGSTQGKIYQYDLRNSSAPTRVTAAHKTSVTCLRFQSSASSKLKVTTHFRPMKRRSEETLHSETPNTLKYRIYISVCPLLFFLSFFCSSLVNWAPPRLPRDHQSSCLTARQTLPLPQAPPP